MEREREKKKTQTKNIRYYMFVFAALFVDLATQLQLFIYFLEAKKNKPDSDF